LALSYFVGFGCIVPAAIVVVVSDQDGMKEFAISFILAKGLSSQKVFADFLFT
jgi:hypothetical protein